MRLAGILGIAGTLVLVAGCDTDLELGPLLRDDAGLGAARDAGVDVSADAGESADAGPRDADVNSAAADPDAVPFGDGGYDLEPDLCLHLEVLSFNRSGDPWSAGQPVSRFSGYAGELLVHQDELLAVTNAHVWVAEMAPTQLLETREGESFTDVQFVDLTGDDQDEAITSGQEVTVFSIESDGWHRSATLSAPEQASSVAAAIADFDEDGNVDIVSLSGAGHVLHLGDGSLEFSSIHLPSEFPLNNIHVYAAQAADVDLDEHMDIVFYATAAVYKQGAEHDASLFVFRGDGSGRFSPTTRTRLPAPELSGVGQRLADFTGDGVLDAVFQIHDTTYLVAGLGDGRFATALPILKGVNAPSFDRSLIAVADITADGLADLAVPDDQAIQLLIATGEGQFAPAEVVPIQNGYLASVALQPSDPAILSALIALDSCSID